MKWDDGSLASDGKSDDPDHKTGDDLAFAISRNQSIHWRRQNKQNEEYVDEASVS